jgi:hypothetical protein
MQKCTPSITVQYQNLLQKTMQNNDAKCTGGERIVKINSPLSSEANYNGPESARPPGRRDRSCWCQVGPPLRPPPRLPVWGSVLGCCHHGVLHRGHQHLKGKALTQVRATGLHHLPIHRSSTGLLRVTAAVKLFHAAHPHRTAATHTTTSRNRRRAPSHRATRPHGCLPIDATACSPLPLAWSHVPRWSPARWCHRLLGMRSFGGRSWHGARVGNGGARTQEKTVQAWRLVAAAGSWLVRWRLLEQRRRWLVRNDGA